ncbi:MAG: hypothetical protein AB7I36_13530 [Rhodospirillaceae bacterium]
MPLLDSFFLRAVDEVLVHFDAWEERLQDLSAVPFSGFASPLGLMHEWTGDNPRAIRTEGVRDHG